MDILALTLGRARESYLLQRLKLDPDQLYRYVRPLIERDFIKTNVSPARRKMFETTEKGCWFLEQNLKNPAADLRTALEEAFVSVVMPAYNEERTLGEVIPRTHKALQDPGIPYEIIVIDDGSTDETAKVAERSGAILIANGRNRGKGNAICAGVEKARGSIIVTMDADGQHQPEEIPKLLYPILRGDLEIDVVIGSRFIGGSRERSLSRTHFVGNKVINLLIRFLTGRWVTDSQSGFRAYRGQLIRSLNIKSLGFEAETEAIVRLLKGGFRIKEVPITVHGREHSNSKLRTWKDGFTIFRTVLTAFLGS